MDMTHDKKTIRLANGTAEEGDRIIYMGDEEEYIGEEGLFEYDEDKDHPYFCRFPMIDDMRLPIWEMEGCLSLGPDNALEAVEEACNTLLTQLEAIDHNSEVRKEAFKAMREEAKATINQKRKGK